MDCIEPRCQVCKFIKESIDSVVSSVTVSDILEGRSVIPFTRGGNYATYFDFFIVSKAQILILGIKKTYKLIIRI